MLGKEKCKYLHEIRQKIADENDIPYVVEECTHQGNCLGTCPKCEADLRYLERELEKRQRLGKAVTVAALAGTLAVSMAACGPSRELGGALINPDYTVGAELQGDPTLPATQPDWEIGGVPIQPSRPDETEPDWELGGKPTERPVSEDTIPTEMPEETTGQE